MSSFSLLSVLLTLALLAGAPDTRLMAQETQKDARGQQFDTPPALDGRMSVSYPETARADSLEGMVMLSITVDTTGTSENIHVLKSVRDDVDQAVVTAMRAVKWKPATLRGQPVKVTISFPVRFKLKK